MKILSHQAILHIMPIIISKHMKRYIYLTIIGCILTGCLLSNSLLTSCKGSSTDNGKPTISVTIEPFRYFVEQIAGDDVNVNVMVPAGSNPETYEPTPQQMVELAHSILYFKVGEIGFETTWMSKLQKNAPKMKTIDTSVGIDMQKTRSGYIDPHTWMSLKNAEIITGNIAKALMEMFPDKAETYKKKYAEYRQHLKELQAKMDKYHSAVKGGSQTSFVIYHPILTYFAKDNGFEQIPLEDEGREPSIGQIQQIINQAVTEKISILFIQKEFANRNVQTFIDATHVKPIEINPLSYNWEGQMFYIMKCMTNSSSSETTDKKD